MNNDEVANLQAICNVTKERATELLGAASGSLERAVDIHFQQQHQVETVPASQNADVIEVDADNEEEEENGKDSKVRQRNEPTTPSSSSSSKKLKSSSNSPRKHNQQSPSSKSNKKQQQQTLHSFFGISTSSGGTPRKKASQLDRKRQPTKTSFQNGNNKSNSPNKASVSTSKIPAVSPLKKKDSPAKPKTGTSTKNQPSKQHQKQKEVDPRLSFTTLAKAFTEMTATTKRNAKLNTLKVVIRGVIEAVGGIHDDDDDREEQGQTLTCALELILGKISLPNSNTVAPIPLQVSGAAVSSALQVVTGGVAKSRLREVYRRTGDLGDTAAEFFSPGMSVKNFFMARTKKIPGGGESNNNNNQSATSQQGASMEQIHSILQAVASVKQGTGSQKERQTLLVKLLRLASTKEEMRFLVRILLGNMRLGATIKSILAALAMASEEIQTGETTTPLQCAAISTLQKTHDICPRLQRIALALLRGGVARVAQDCTLEVGVPVQPMLANPAHSLEEVKKLMTKGASNHLDGSPSCTSEAVAEWKYDGMRCQSHFDGTNIKLFSRHLLDTTLQFPDAANFMLEARQEGKVKSFIIDAEIVAVSGREEKDGVVRLLPFQVLSTRRGTKNNDDVKIRVFVFDLMYLNGESLLSKSYWERRDLLGESFRETPGFAFASSMTLQCYNEAGLSDYLSEAVSGGAEGLMLKLTGRMSFCPETAASTTDTVPPSLPCPYESGTRSATWLKLKRDYVSGFADTIDIVPIGAWYGNGRKAEKGFLSPILFAIYDEDDGVFRSISRCMSFTDSMYSAIKDFYFNGTPYPANVGVVGADSTQKDPAGTVVDENVGSDDEKDGTQIESNDDDISVSDNDNDDGGDDSFVGVNCFPGRPSSSVYITNESPSIWFKPCEVWEVSFADLSLSRTHTAAAGLVDDSEGRGVALRFPRFKRRRPDKGVEQATTSAQIAQLFTKQFKQR